MPSKRAAILVLAVAVVALGSSGALAAQAVTAHTAAAKASAFTVVGYDEAGSTSRAQFVATKGIVTTIGVDGVNVAPTATHIDTVSDRALQGLHQAHKQGQRAELLVGNFDGRLGDFSPEIGDRLLGSPANIDRVVRDLRAEVVRHGWDGVTVDLESLTSRHPAGLTSLVTRLKTALGTGKTVSICLMATDQNDYADYGYDLSALGRAADKVVLMGYDQHGPTWTTAGPVGGQPWVAASLAPLTKAIPRAKLQLGIAGYGYTWPKKGDGVQLSDRQARAAVAEDGANARWSTTQLEWTATLSNGTVIWWSDPKSYAARVAYAKKLHLSGVAVWSLGLSDPLPRN